MIVPNGNHDNEDWQNAIIGHDNEQEFQPLQRQFANEWPEQDNEDWQNARIGNHDNEDWQNARIGNHDNEDWQNARIGNHDNEDWQNARIGQDNEDWQNARIGNHDNEDWQNARIGQDNEDLGPHPLDGLPWEHPDVQAELAIEAVENEDAQELYEPLNQDVDYTIPAGDNENCDPRIEHVPALNRQHGDQICEVTLDCMSIVFHRKRNGNKTEETLEFPEEFRGQKCKFFDAAGTLCVMVFEADGVNTLIYDFFTGQVLGGGAMPEALDWNRDVLRKVVLSEGEGLQVVITNDAEGIRNIMIGI
jgi:hypothetical protein